MSLNLFTTERLVEVGPDCLSTILIDIMSGKAPIPYTADAFFAFVSYRHCTESFNFIIRVRDYYEQYASLQASSHQITTPESARVEAKWRCIMSTFIAPGSVQEINVPSRIRNQLLSLDLNLSPPRPENLNSAFCHISETVTHNILVPFLRSMPISGQETTQQHLFPNGQWLAPRSTTSYREKSFLKRSPSALKKLGEIVRQLWRQKIYNDKLIQVPGSRTDFWRRAKDETGINLI